MALSDREKRLLAEMEAALASDDPSLQTTLTGTHARERVAGIASSLLLLMAGLVILFIGLIAKLTFVGAAGFLVGVGGLLALLRTLSQLNSAPAVKIARKGRLSDSLNERWKRRQGN
jgi:hypothetical protein